MLKGLLAGGIVLGLSAVFPQELAFSFFAVLLGFVAGVGPGMFWAHPEKEPSAPEWMAALFLVSLALLGLWGSPLILAAAWVGHSLWSGLHTITALGDGLPEGYYRFCLTFDLVAAGFVTYMWTVVG